MPLAGVIFNRVAGQRHRALLEAALARYLPDVPCLGAMPQDARLAMPQRHLGLVPAGEQSDRDNIIAAAATHIAAGVDVDGVIAAARPSTLPAGGTSPCLPPLGRHIAVARDDAFVFAYPTILEDWRRQGADLSFFSPLAGGAPDESADAVYLPGGYPELHAGRVAAAANFVAGLRQAEARGAAIYGECGGYMVLGETLTDAAGAVHRMAGLLPLATSFAERRLHLGYRAATLCADGPFGAAGAKFRGHEFHYATVVREGGAAPLFAVADATGSDLGQAGLCRGRVAGSFIHLIDRAE